MIAWALITFGITLVVTGSSLFKPFRASLRPGFFQKLLSCPMCFGWWTGAGLELVMRFGPAPEPWPLWMAALADGFASSAVCWTWHVVLVRLGADEL
jgi:hypothetical protein